MEGGTLGMASQAHTFSAKYASPLTRAFFLVNVITLFLLFYIDSLVPLQIPIIN